MLKRIFERLRERYRRDTEQKQAERRLFAIVTERRTIVLDGKALRALAAEGVERQTVFQAVYDLLQAGRIALGATDDGRLVVSPNVPGAARSEGDDFSDAILAGEIRT